MVRDKGKAMADANKLAGVDDPHNLSRFVDAQDGVYERALAEIKDGRKRSHWMWFIFPQFAGLGFSSTSRLYAIKSVAEAQAYLDHLVLGPRLIECAEAVLSVQGKSAFQIFGSPDDAKLRSCATLFAHIAPPTPFFDRLIDVYFGGQRDDKTLQLLGAPPRAG